MTRNRDIACVNDLCRQGVDVGRSSTLPPVDWYCCALLGCNQLVPGAYNQHESSASRWVQETAEDAKRQGESTWQRIKETVTGTADKASDTAAEVQRQAGETAEQYQRRLEQYADAAKRQAQVILLISNDEVSTVQYSCGMMHHDVFS